MGREIKRLTEKIADLRKTNKMLKKQYVFHKKRNIELIEELLELKEENQELRAKLGLTKKGVME